MTDVSSQVVLQIDGLSYALGDAHRRINIRPVVLDAGRLLVVEGVSGSGKSTLLKVIARLYGHDGGEVRLLGQSWLEFSPTAWRRRVQYLAQKPVIFPGSALDNLQRAFQVAAVKREMDFHLENARLVWDRLLLSRGLLDQRAVTMSGGEAARMALARALLLDPAVLLLDEPAAALDEASKSACWDAISSWLEETSSRAAIMVSHGSHDRFSGMKVLRIEGGCGLLVEG